jgi:phosphoribosyl 1,2-cyclic phosphodiesterase
MAGNSSDNSDGEALKPKAEISFCVLASGSRGNSIYISDGPTSILLDAGLSGIEIERRLKTAGLSPDKLNAILVSHEHSDHIKGVGVLSRRYNLPVYITRETARYSDPVVGKLSESFSFECGSVFKINTLSVRPFSLSHDAADPAGFTFSSGGLKIGIATDLGIVTSMVKTRLKGCSALILEANHDPSMLINGPYPWPLKQRVQGRTGHLSNAEAGALLKELLHSRLSHVVLAHLSETNNTPEKALNDVGLALHKASCELSAARQDRCGKIFRLMTED